MNEVYVTLEFGILHSCVGSTLRSCSTKAKEHRRSKAANNSTCRHATHLVVLHAVEQHPQVEATDVVPNLRE